MGSRTMSRRLCEDKLDHDSSTSLFGMRSCSSIDKYPPGEKSRIDQRRDVSWVPPQALPHDVCYAQASVGDKGGASEQMETETRKGKKKGVQKEADH